MIMELMTMAQEGAAHVVPVASGIGGSMTAGLAGLGAAIGVGLIGAKAAEAVGRNPGAFGNVLTMSIIGMALGIGIPVGFLAGSSVWEAATRDLGVATDAAHLWWPVALFAVAAVVVTGAIGLQVGAGAARMSTSASLHQE